MNKDKKYICIHGHFYQPPRENAWLETLGIQKSAVPFHDWNERITSECYAPNGHARILDSNGFIRKIVNNYTHISFNFGPTLLSWMEVAEPGCYKAIIEADQASIDYFNGYGSAVAQVYNHIIMPLANEHDKYTQVIWGIRDFEHRFKRKPKGMWLAETAVDMDTLEVLVDHGIEFTILAPRQAKSIRPDNNQAWEELDHAAVDPRRPYVCQLKNGRSITLFFYDGHVSQGVAFSGLLNSGKDFAKSLINTLDDNGEVQLAHIATDGESYGHHHKKGEMALADCLGFITEKENVTLCNYAAFLAEHPASWEVVIHENSSWSCVHGVERWRSNCGCHTGGHENWTQAWRKPLRETLDWLRDQMIPIFEQEAALFFKDPWAARNDYVSIVLDRSLPAWDLFLSKHTLRKLSKEEASKCRQLLEMQRQSMLMFTSCGWFFDEISGLETNQILQYAHRAMVYADGLSGLGFQAEFICRLEKAPSNKYVNGAESYREFVMPSRVDIDKIARYFIVAQLSESLGKMLSLFNYRVEYEVVEKLNNEQSQLLLGYMTLQSEITLVKASFCYAVVQNKNEINGQLSLQMNQSGFEKISKIIKDSFKIDLDKTIEAIRTCFGAQNFTTKDLFEKNKMEDEEGFDYPKNQHERWPLKASLDNNLQQRIHDRLLTIQYGLSTKKDIDQLINMIEDFEKLGVQIDFRKQQELFFDQMKDSSFIENKTSFDLLGLKLNIKAEV